MASSATDARVRLLGQTVQLEKDLSETDRFGRLLRYVWTDVGLFNEQIVRDGFATLATFPPDIKYVERIRAAQQEANEAGRGLWGRGHLCRTSSCAISAHADRNHRPRK